MNSPLLKKILPHFIAIVVFIIVSALFCKPILDGNVMNQHDTVGWKGMAQNSFEYKKAHGHFPLWNPNLFSGMPNYQVAMEGKTILPDTTKIFSLGLPKPINFFFLACLCFYILCLVMGIKPVIGMLAALAYSFSTYNPVIIAAGHDTQMLATAFMPLLMAGLISTYEKKYWLGLALTTFGTYQQVAMNHLQVSYYFFLIAAFVTIFYLVKWIKEKDWKHIGIAGAITVVSGIIGLAGNAMVLKSTSEYSKYTMRGGKNISIEGDSVKAVKTKGLDTAYAFEYSLGKAETFTLLMPNAFGGGSYARLGEGSKVAKKLIARGIPDSNAEQVAQSMPKYWGKIFTAGPAYLGVLIFLLGIVGVVILKTPLRWGLLAATLLGVFMTWGKYFAGFNVFLFENLPLYNKFRAPSFAQVIPQLAMGVLAALTLQQLLFSETAREQLKKKFKPILYSVGGVFLLLALLYIGMDYGAPVDQQIISGYTDKNGSDEMGRLIVSGLKSERQAMFGGQIMRALGIAILAAAIFLLYAKNKIKSLTSAILLLVISTVDITLSSYKYFNNENDQYRDRPDNEKLFVSKEDYASTNFNPSPVESVILKDKDPNFRVFNMLGTSSGSPFAESHTSYFFKSIGGYHPAKLRTYQDIIEKYLSASPNQQVLNMLNTKYFIGADPQTQQPLLMPNAEAYGNCWFVKNVKLVADPVEAITVLGNTNLKDTAIVEKSFEKLVTQPQRDSAATIKMTMFDNDAIEYESNSSAPQFAVFSEIYYPAGWNAYIDGKKTDYVSANYILRGLSVPAGKHMIKFVFEPASVKQGRSIMFIASILIALIFIGGLYMTWRESRKTS
ncbi:MAG: YfhO family protein [Sphingobacteriales bacterium]|nr:YfhO family protein [Sphingobacteriales bacterium]